MIETIDDIVGDIRAQNQGLPEDGYALSPYVSDLLRLADRIEAAHKREREATCKKSLQVGNSAAMRDCAVDSKFPHGDYEAMKNALERVASEMIYLIDAEGSRVRFQPRAILDDVEHVLKNLGRKKGDCDEKEVRWICGNSKGEVRSSAARTLWQVV